MTDEDNPEMADDDQEDEEDRPIQFNMDEGEALALLHVLWQQELDWAGEPETMPLAQVMSNLSSRISREVYSDQIVDWMDEQMDEQEELREEFEERFGGEGMGAPPEEPGSFGAFQ